MVESGSRILTRIRHKDINPTGSWSATLCSNFKSWIFFFLVYPCLRTKHSCNKLSLVMIVPQKAPGNHHLTAAGREDVHVCCGAEGEVWFGQAWRRHFCTPRKEDCSVILQGHLQVHYIELIVIKIWSGRLFRNDTVFCGGQILKSNASRMAIKKKNFVYYNHASGHTFPFYLHA